MFSLDATRWVPQVHKGFAGYRCLECGQLRHASEFLNCQCQSDTQFIICGRDAGECVFWNNENGWIHDITEATTFPKGILGESLPPGGEGIMELTLTGENVGYYPCTPPTGGGRKL